LIFRGVRGEFEPSGFSPIMDSIEVGVAKGVVIGSIHFDFENVVANELCKEGEVNILVW